MRHLLQSLSLLTTLATLSATAPGVMAQTVVNNMAETLIPILPSGNTRGVFVEQIGEANVSNVSQENASSFARTKQTGERNEASLTQNGLATGYADIRQDGSDNNVTATQQGDDGTQNTLLLVQNGDSNVAITDQAGSNAAILGQYGNGNAINLNQNGSDNLASLSQEGDDNIMSISQLGQDNQLQWTQQGIGLTDLQVDQSGGARLAIIQSNNN